MWTLNVFSRLILGQARLHLLSGIKCFSLLMIKQKCRLLLVTSMLLGTSLLITRPLSCRTALSCGSARFTASVLQPHSHLVTKCDGALAIPGGFPWKVTQEGKLSAPEAGGEGSRSGRASFSSPADEPILELLFFFSSLKYAGCVVSLWAAWRFGYTAGRARQVSHPALRSQNAIIQIGTGWTWKS